VKTEEQEKAAKKAAYAKYLGEQKGESSLNTTRFSPSPTSFLPFAFRPDWLRRF
jgi:hypothetical protein